MLSWVEISPLQECAKSEHFASLMKEWGLAESRSEAERLLRQGAVEVAGEAGDEKCGNLRVDDPAAQLEYWQEAMTIKMHGKRFVCARLAS